MIRYLKSCIIVLVNNWGQKMDADLISFETLIATRDSAYWVMWGAIATSIAAISSIITLYFAFAALNTWKVQEKTKIKSELKRSLFALDYAIHMMPDDWNAAKAAMIQMNESSFLVTQGSDKTSAAYSELKKRWHNALTAWVMCEGLLFETELTGLWNELSNIYIEYIQGRTSKVEILQKLSEMHKVKFIFD